jgi:hypothetical protein
MSWVARDEALMCFKYGVTQVGSNAVCCYGQRGWAVLRVFDLCGCVHYTCGGGAELLQVWRHSGERVMCEVLGVLLCLVWVRSAACV